MPYIQVNSTVIPKGEKARAISKELDSLQYEYVKPEDKNTMMFDVVEHDGEAYLWVSTDLNQTVIDVHANADLMPLINLFPELSLEQKTAMSAYLRQTQQPVVLQYLLPPDTKVLSTKEMADLGAIAG